VETPAVPALLIGTIFVEKGLITQDQLDVALEEQQKTGNRLGEILVERFGVSRLDLASALAEQWAEYERQGSAEQQAAPTEVRDLAAAPDEWSAEDEIAAAAKRPLGEIFVERGMINEGDLERALEEQRASGRRLGEILVGQGNLTRLELASALADQWASFQKLRPPTQSNGVRARASSDGPVMPTPEVAPVAGSVPGSDPTPLRADIAALAARVDELAAHIGALSAADAASVAPESVDELRASISSLAARLEEVERAGEGWRGAMDSMAEDLRERIGAAVQQPHRSDETVELRSELAALAARLDALPAPTDEWRVELDQVAEDLRARLEQVDSGLVSRQSEELDGVRAEIAVLASRLDALPAPSEEWRDGLASLAGRIESFDDLRVRLDRIQDEVAARADHRALAELSGRLDELDARLPDRLGELRAALRQLTDRVEALPAPSDESRVDLAEVIGEKLAELEDVPRQIADLRTELGGLASRLDTIPVPPDLSEPFAALWSRLDELAAAPPPGLDELRTALAAVVEQVEAIPRQSGELQNELAGVAEDLRVRLERVEAGLELRPGLDLIAGLREELQGVTARLEWRIDESERRHDELAGRLRRVDEVSSRIDGLDSRLQEALEQRLAERNDDGGQIRADLAHAVERLEAFEPALARIEQLERRFDGLQTEGPTAAEIAETVRSRLDAYDSVATDAFASFDHRLAELDGRVAASAERTASDVESLRRELDDVRGVTVASAAASAVQVDQLAEALRGEIASALAHTDHREAIERLGELAAQHGTALDALHAELREREHRLDERLASRTAELAALRTRFEHVEGGLGQASEGWRVAAAELTERFGELDAAQATAEERLVDLEKAQAKRSDIRDLREELALIERRVAAEADTEDARNRAVEEALRDGLASLGARIAETESTYVHAGDALRRSIERLGSAIRAADAGLASASAAVDGDAVPPMGVEATSFLAFAPTAEGYRLVECEGAPPVVGATVEVPDCETPFVVTRLGVSPLPFDRRACAYLARV
jgi:chromosome segregation ATPase